MGLSEGFADAPKKEEAKKAEEPKKKEEPKKAEPAKAKFEDGSEEKAKLEGFADLASYEGPAKFAGAEAPAGCYPRDQLTPSELLPKDMASVWAEQNPMGPGSLKGKNFLSAGALIGVNTVGQSMRNANLQVRSEPPNPQVAVSIFNQSTISPDISHRPLEIGA
uniref:Minor capsid protein P11 C-terminal conserved region domain-containing protein n=1 Tax=viral metagenome TaxID=1070528 RepID=A0A6C0KVP0_9ZZZZ